MITIVIIVTITFVAHCYQLEVIFVVTNYLSIIYIVHCLQSFLFGSAPRKAVHLVVPGRWSVWAGPVSAWLSSCAQLYAALFSQGSGVWYGELALYVFRHFYSQVIKSI